MKDIVPLGTLITKNPRTVKRDAIHLAIVPVINGHDWGLNPGTRVKFLNDDGITVTQADYDDDPEAFGILDPFVPGTIGKGQAAYAVLFPNTVTGMTHHWSHPIFDKLSKQVVPEEPKREYTDDEKNAALLWLTEFGKQHHSSNAGGEFSGGRRWQYSGWGGTYSAKQLIDFATEFLNSGHKHVQQGHESLRDDLSGDKALRKEFWQNIRIVTGLYISEDMEDIVPFCCTC